MSEGRYTPLATGHIQLFRCYDCGSLVDAEARDTHDDWEDGYGLTVSASLWVSNKQLNELRDKLKGESS